MINPKDAWDALEPFALAWLEKYLGTTGGAQMDISHDAAAHAGSVADTHIPQALLLAGTRAMTGPFQSPSGQVVIVGGAQITVKAGSQAAAGFTAASAASFDVTVLTGHGARFTAGDAIRMHDGTSDVWALIDSIAGDVLTCTHKSGPDPVEFLAGTPVMNYGASGDGWVEVRADSGTAPRVSVYTHAGAPWTTSTEHARLGNLNDYTAGAYGLVAIAGTVGGTRTQLDATGLRGYNGATEQFALDSATGKATAGAGAVTLDSDGVTIATGTGDVNKIKFVNSGNDKGYIFTNYIALSKESSMSLQSFNPETAGYAQAILDASTDDPTYQATVATLAKQGTASASYAKITINGTDELKAEVNKIIVYNALAVGTGLYVGNSAGTPTDNDIHADGDIDADGSVHADVDVDADGDLIADGTVSTNGGTTKWDLGAYSASTITPDGKIEVTINGTTYEIACREKPGA